MKKVITVHKNGLSTWLLKIFLFWTFVSKRTYFMIIVCFAIFYLSSVNIFWNLCLITILIKRSWCFYFFFFFHKKNDKIIFCLDFPKDSWMYIIYLHFIFLFTTTTSQSLDTCCYFKTPFDDDVYLYFHSMWGINLCNDHWIAIIFS